MFPRSLHQMRSKLDGELRDFILPTDKEKFQKELDDMEMWMEDEEGSQKSTCEKKSPRAHLLKKQQQQQHARTQSHAHTRTTHTTHIPHTRTHTQHIPARSLSDPFVLTSENRVLLGTRKNLLV